MGVYDDAFVVWWGYRAFEKYDTVSCSIITIQGGV